MTNTELLAQAVSTLEVVKTPSIQTFLKNLIAKLQKEIEHEQK